MENNDQKLEKDLKHVYRKQLRDSLEEQMNDLEEENSSQKNQVARIFPLKTFLAIAASVLLVVSLFWMNNSSSAEDLFVENFEMYENYVRPTTRNVAPQSNAQKAYAAYDQGNYEKALEFF